MDCGYFLLIAIMDSHDSWCKHCCERYMVFVYTNLSVLGIELEEICLSLVEHPVRCDYFYVKNVICHEITSHYCILARTSSMLPTFKK